MNEHFEYAVVPKEFQLETPPVWRRIDEVWKCYSVIDQEWVEPERLGQAPPPATAAFLLPVTDRLAAELMTGRPRKIRYWAVYDHHDWEIENHRYVRRPGKSPFNVVRSWYGEQDRREREHTQLFYRDARWREGTEKVFLFFNPRDKRPDFLLEICEEEADEILLGLFGVADATQQA